jgi:tRNA A-37 threonylcarbamoyl transferase component Bud32
MQRLVAVKVIHCAAAADPAAVERFRREGRAAARLRHPHVVSTYDAEDAGETLFLVMEYVEGVSLGQLVKDQGPLPVCQACTYARQAALGLQHAHERGMVHRDVKPDNLILAAPPGEAAPGVVKVLDFGLAVLAEEHNDRLTSTNVIMGTPDYLAPEQAEDARNADTRSDVYSLGCTLYHLLTGHTPYPAATAVLKILAHRDQPPPSLLKQRPGVPPGLERVLRRMLAKRPGDRYQTPGEAAAALEPFTRPNPPRPPRKRWPLVVACAAALFAGVVLSLGVYRIQTDNGEFTIRTDDPQVEVVLRKGGQIVRLRDPVSGKTWELDANRYQIGLADEAGGLTIGLEEGQTVTLRRKGRAVLTVTRGKAGPPPGPVAPAGADRIQVLHRMQHVNRGWKMVKVARDGKRFAAIIDGATHVWDGKTGKELYRLPCGGGLEFSPDGSRLYCTPWDVMQVHESATGKKLFDFRLTEQLWSIEVLPGNRHAVVITALQRVYLYELGRGKVLQSWPLPGVGPYYAFTSDGGALFVKPPGQKSWLAWDVRENKPSAEFARITTCDIVWSFRPGDKQAYVRDGGKDYLVRLADGKRLGLFPAYPTSPLVGAARCRTDYLILLGADAKGNVQLWNLRTGKVQAVFKLPDGEKLAPGPTMDLSPDGRYAAVLTDRAVYLLKLPKLAPGKDKP